MSESEDPEEKMVPDTIVRFNNVQPLWTVLKVADLQHILDFRALKASFFCIGRCDTKSDVVNQFWDRGGGGVPKKTAGRMW
jgi:hypothetical protein